MNELKQKADDLHLAFNAIEIRTPLEDMSDAKQKLFESFLSTFASEIKDKLKEETFDWIGFDGFDYPIVYKSDIDEIFSHYISNESN